MRIKAEDSLGVIIDIQEKLFPYIFNNKELLFNTEKLIKGLKILTIPFLLTEQYRKGLGCSLPVITDLLPEAGYIEKMSFSCCDTPVFMKELGKMDKKNVIIAGIESHVCVLQTVIDLAEAGFLPVVVEDCVSSRKMEDKRIALHRMRQEGAVITSSESLLFELVRISGSDTFKAISKLVK